MSDHISIANNTSAGGGFTYGPGLPVMFASPQGGQARRRRTRREIPSLDLFEVMRSLIRAGIAYEKRLTSSIKTIK